MRLLRRAHASSAGVSVKPILNMLSFFTGRNFYKSDYVSRNCDAKPNVSIEFLEMTERARNSKNKRCNFKLGMARASASEVVLCQISGSLRFVNRVEEMRI
jgi:hypothetical protein